MKIIVGLGNPGLEYSKTRHNVGFIILDFFASKKGLEWSNEDKFNSVIAKGEGFILVKPTTYMNNSGDAVQKLLNFHKLDTSELLVVHDDVDLPFGVIKTSKDSQAAGHHGVLDIINKLSSKDFYRLRFGIGRPEDRKFDVSDYVLSKFTQEEFDFISKFDLLPYLK